MTWQCLSNNNLRTTWPTFNQSQPIFSSDHWVNAPTTPLTHVLNDQEERRHAPKRLCLSVVHVMSTKQPSSPSCILDKLRNLSHFSYGLSDVHSPRQQPSPLSTRLSIITINTTHQLPYYATARVIPSSIETRGLSNVHSLLQTHNVH
jgi:hypothetical protein